MRKPELAAAIADQTGLTREKASDVISAFTSQISAAAAKGDDVTLIGFGTFNVRRREARTGRNPQTGATIDIPASKTVGFKAGKALKDAIRWHIPARCATRDGFHPGPAQSGGTFQTGTIYPAPDRHHQL